MIWKPHVTVAAVVQRQGQYLFVEERVRGQLVLNQPAGHLEPGETLQQAVVRETLEETGWTVSPTALLKVFRWDNRRGKPFLRFTFACSAQTHDPAHHLDEGIERALWLSPEALAKRTDLRSPLVAEAVLLHRSGTYYPLDLLCTWPDHD